MPEAFAQVYINFFSFLFGGFSSKRKAKPLL